MIDRYSRPEMMSIWTEEAKYSAWAEVEEAHLRSLVDRGEAPLQVIESFRTAFQSKTVDQFLRRERETHHDVIAFVAEVGDAMGEHGHFLHKGLTSSDILDTSLALRVVRSLSVILSVLQKLRENLAVRAFEHALTPCIGRTHGIHAEPMSFGQALSGHFAEFQRAHLQLLQAQKQMSFGKLSGAVGTYSQLTPGFEASVLGRLDLLPETVATQVIPRDRLVAVAHAALAVANAIERFALNVRHWARTELAEVLEPFATGQKGSSAMPHKQNPILAENLCGLARAIRGYVGTLGENAALWHERDISHSSVERLVLPDLFVTLDFMVARCSALVEKMRVFPEAMAANLWRTGGLWASQSVLTALVESGMNRTQAYELVQAIALEISEKRVQAGMVTSQDAFLKALLGHNSVSQILGAKTIEGLFDLGRYLKSTAVLFQRVFALTPEEYARKADEPVAQSVPALHKVIKVTVELLPDVLDTEGKTIARDMQHAGCQVLSLRQQRCFLVRLPGNATVHDVRRYANEVLHNAVMERVLFEVIQ